MVDFSQPMRTFAKMHNDCAAAGAPCAYWGARGEWLVVVGQTRDSDVTDRSNFHSMLKLLGGESDTVAIERESHWACGWVEFILVDPSAADALAIAADARERLDGYPILDESDHSELESEECAEVWEKCYNPRDRVKYLRRHSFTGSFRDILAAVRGDWYVAGNILHCPSDILY